ncbi:hypothetical protein BCU93_17825, partial [Vibrio breoganii]
MKILILGPYLSENGLGTVCANLSKAFYINACDVSIVCKYRTGRELDYSGTLHTLNEIGDNLSLLDNFKFYLSVKKIIKDADIDAVISIGPSFDIINCLISKRALTITTVHNNYRKEYGTIYRFLMNFVLRSSDLVVPVSAALTDMLNIDFNNKYANKIVSIPNPVDKKDPIKSVNSVKEQDYFVCVGRLENQKALWHVVGSARYITRKTKILIFGEGSFRKQIEKLIDEFGVGHIVELRGYSSEVNEFIDGAKGLILTSLYEGLPMVIIESMMLGTPVISVQCQTGPKEMIANNSGILLQSPAIEWKDYIDSKYESKLDHELSEVINSIEDSEIKAMSIEAKNMADRYTINNV